MIIEHLKYTDFDGNEREEDFYFNLTQAEIVDMNLSVEGGLQETLSRIMATKDVPKIAQYFKKIIDSAYGVKSADGRRFIKNQQVLDDFRATQAYSDLYVKLATDSEEAAKFINGIVPKA